MKKLTVFPAKNPSFSAPGAFALLAGAGLLLASGTQFQSIAEHERISIDLAAFSYLTQLHVDLDRGNSKAEAELRAMQDSQYKFADAAQPVTNTSYAPKIAIHYVRPHQVSQSKITRVAPHVAQEITQPSILMTTQDRLPAVQAAPLKENTAGAVLIEDAQATAAQLEAFQQMHRELRMQFLAALTSPPSMTTQVATQAEVLDQNIVSATDQAVEHVAAPVRAPAHKTRKAHRPVHHQVKSAPKAAATEAKAALIDRFHLEVPSAAGSLIHSNVQGSATAVSLVRDSALGNAQQPAAPAETPSVEKAYAQISELSQSVFAGMNVAHADTVPVLPAAQAAAQPKPAAPAVAQATESVTTQYAAPAPSQAQVIQKASSGSTVLVGTTREYSPGTRSDYSSLNLFKLWQAWNNREQATATPAPTGRPQGTRLADAGQVSDTASDASRGVISQTPAVVEAYEWKTAVTAIASETITLEGWKRLRANDHWPVIHWNPDSQAHTAMISHNTAVMLSKLADVQLQPDAAIVFGKIPAGWNVEFSDRAERVIYTDEHNRFDAPSDEPRYFAFLNAAPGAQVVTLKAALGADTAAVAVPVLNGSSTYLDLTAVSKRGFSGYVLDAGSQIRKGVPGAAVSVNGQPNDVFFATESGYFHLSEVFAVGDYPVFVETTTPQGFKHRYRVTPGRMEGVDLYRMSDAQIMAWVGQLERGVSPDGGMIVAAMPSLVRRYGDGRLFPSIKTLLGNRTLDPETYTVSENGQLDPDRKMLELAGSRFVSVQVPAGPVVSQVEDNNRNVVWSQLVLAQPGVVNVVGPY